LLALREPPSQAMTWGPSEMPRANEDPRVFGNSADFWPDIQRRNDLWEAMHSPKERERIARTRLLKAA
jgi:hypothetical protein